MLKPRGWALCALKEVCMCKMGGPASKFTGDLSGAGSLAAEQAAVWVLVPFGWT